MQAMIGKGLRAHYKAPPKLSHELFVLLMQLNEQERRGKPAQSRSGARRGKANVSTRSAAR
jgi:hypothetical protein